jgi:hypothetical protein
MITTGVSLVVTGTRAGNRPWVLPRIVAEDTMIALPRGEMSARTAPGHWILIHLGAGMQRKIHPEDLEVEGMTQSAHGGMTLRLQRPGATRLVHNPQAQPDQSRQMSLLLPPGDTISSGPPLVPAEQLTAMHVPKPDEQLHALLPLMTDWQED